MDNPQQREIVMFELEAGYGGWDNQTPPAGAAYFIESDDTNSVTSPPMWNSMTSQYGAEMNKRLQSVPDIETRLILYVFPVVLFLGTVGNVLSIVVLQRKAMKTSCSSVYLSALAVADILVLYVSGFKTWLRVATGFELLHAADCLCRLIKYVFYTSTHFSAWIVVVVTLERLLVVYTPFRASDLWIVRRPELMTLASGLVVMVININIIWSSQLVNRLEDATPACVSYTTDNFTCIVFPKLNLLVYSVIPSILVFTFNIIILVVLFRNIPPCNVDLNARKRNFKRHSHQRRLTMTLLTLSTLWLVLSLPYSIIDSRIEVLVNAKIPRVVRVVCFMMMYLNHSVNFYVYCLLGQKFRTELKRTFRFRTYKFVRDYGRSQDVAIRAQRVNGGTCVHLRSKRWIDNLYN